MIVGIDLALTTTGFATLTATGALAWGRIPPPGSRHPIGERLDHLRQHTKSLAVGAELVVEGTVVRSSAAVALGQVHGAVLHGLWELGSRVVVVSPATVKTLATGRGNAPKPDVRGAARNGLGYTGESDDEADACWLADLGGRLLGFDRPALPQVHLRALAKVTGWSSTAA